MARNASPARPERDRYSTRRVLAVALPMIVANISTPLLGMVETAILGHLDSALYLGAVALGANLITLLFWMFGFLRMGTTGFVSRLDGSGRQAEMVELLQRVVWLALILATGLLVLHPLLLEPAVALLSREQTLDPLALEYAQIRIWAAPATLVTYCIMGWFIGVQKARVPLYVLLATNLLNIALDVILVIGLGLNHRGAALASLASEYVGLIVAATFLVAELSRLGQRIDWRKLPAVGGSLELVRVNADLFVRTLLLLGTFLFFTSQGSSIGVETLAANAILLSLLAFVAYALDGFAFAAEALVGHAVGAGDRDGFRAAIARSTRLAALIAVLFTALLLVTRDPLLWLFTDLPEVRQIAAAHYHWLALLPLIAVGCYQMDGVFIGAGLSAELRNSMLVSTLLVFLPVWAITRDFGNDGLWLAMIAFHLARLATQLLWLRARHRALFAIVRE